MDVHTAPPPLVEPARPVSTKLALSIVLDIAERTGVAFADITGDTRSARVMPARIEAYRALRDAGATYPQIGRYMQRDHSTIVQMLKAHGL